MEKKGSLIFVSLVLGTIFLTLVSAGFSEEGYSCLEDRIDQKNCEDLSLEEQIFSVLATGKCSKELQNNTLNNGTCWGTGKDCDVKLTSQAILALKETEEDVGKPVKWLLLQNQTYLGVNWYLQINSPAGTNCTLNNSEGDYKIRVNTEDELEKVSDSNFCFQIDNNYRIKIDPDCYERKLTVSCDNSFETSFLLKGQTSDSIHVSDLTGSGLENEKLNLNVNSLYFGDYERSLWAALALSKSGEEISPFLPYLIAMSEDKGNQEYLPESFLYFLTGDDEYSSKLISKQNEEGYWEESGNGYYDTSVALFPFASDDFPSKSNATSWLEEEQDGDGCWDDGDIIDTAFILFSTSSAPASEGEDSSSDACRDNGGFCMSDSECREGEGSILSDYECSVGWEVCCSEEKQEARCEDAGGTVCEQGEECSGSINDKVVESNCCVEGECVEPQEDNETEEQEDSECVSNYGSCKESCGSEEEEANYSCTNPTEKCCVTKEKDEGYTWLWAVFGVLVIIAIAFIFRKKLSGFFKEKFGGKGEQQGSARGRGPGQGGQGGRPPQSPPQQPRRQPQQRQQPQQSKRQPPQRPRRSKDLDKTMSKLKEMSK